MDDRPDLPRAIHSHEQGAGRMPHWALLLPAYTLLPLLRSPVGQKLVYPANAFGVAFFLCVLPPIFWLFYVAFSNHAPPANLGHRWLVAFALVYFLAACVVFLRRARGLRTGAEIHTEEAGYSALTYRTGWPVPLCEMLLMPVLIWLAGRAIAHSFSMELGYWLMASAFSYLRMSYWEHCLLWARRRTPIDGIVRFNIFNDDMERHEAQTQRPGGSGAGRPDTGGWTGSYRADRATAAGRDADPDAARPGDLPDVAAWRSSTDGIAPDSMGWLRRRRRER